MADKIDNLRESGLFVEQATERTEPGASSEFQAGSSEQPKFSQFSEVENGQAIEQVVPIPAAIGTEPAVDYEPKYTSANYGSTEKAQEALVLESLLGNTPLDEAVSEMDRALDFPATVHAELE